MGTIAFLWQAAVAGHHALGEPLRCVIIGPAETVRMMEAERVAPGARAFELVGWVDDRAEPGARGSTLAPCLGTLDDLERVAYGGGVDLFVIGVRTGRPALYGRLLELLHLDVSVMEFPPFFERTFGRVPLEGLTPTWFLHTMHLHRRDEESVSKRLLDLLLAGVGLILASPIIVGAAIAVRLRGGPGPVIFRQTRIGEHGRRFTMLKFRSMRNDISNDGTTWTGEDDPRITGRRQDPAALPHRRAAAAGERAARRDDDGRPAARDARLRPLAGGRDPVLQAAPLHEARHHRLGPGLRRVRLVARRHAHQAVVRPLLHPQPLVLARPGDHPAHVRDGADRQRSEVSDLILAAQEYALKNI